ncbi:hypothetical protein JW960_26760 [candidate division KSB1 bacterium]|nr:hypothetical protein [candidate division KSB1 bacterium]
MNELCIPLPYFDEHQIAEVLVTINGKKKKYNFRVESFPWQIDDDSVSNVGLIDRIDSLKVNLKNYDQSWELIQIFTPKENAKYIQVLFRQKE